MRRTEKCGPDEEGPSAERHFAQLLSMAKPSFHGTWESGDVTGLDEFLEARGVPYLKRMIGVPIQTHITQRLRQDAPDVLVQQSSSLLSTFTQVQRVGQPTTATDASGGSVTLSTSWEGDVWVVTSHEVDPATGRVNAEKAPIVTRRRLVGADKMEFSLSTQHCDGSGRVVTATRVFTRVSRDAGGVPSAAEAENAGTVPGSAWSSLFGSR
jgi:hypothetical protein